MAREAAVTENDDPERGEGSRSEDAMSPTVSLLGSHGTAVPSQGFTDARSEIIVLALKLSQQGEGEIPGLTDRTLPQRLGPKR